MNKNATITLLSEAQRWRELAGCIQDALFDAQHSSAGLNGAKPKVSVLLSRTLLSLAGSGNSAAMREFCSELRQQGVGHSFHCVAHGSPEPSAHLVQITLD